MAGKRDITRLIFSISSLADLGQEVTSAKSFNERMKTALYVVTGMFSVPKAALLAYNSNQHRLEVLTYKGLKEADGANILLKMKHIKSFSKNEPYSLNEMKTNSFFEHNTESFVKLQTKTFVPLFAKDEFVGAICLGKRLSSPSYLRTEKMCLR